MWGRSGRCGDDTVGTACGRGRGLNPGRASPAHERRTNVANDAAAGHVRLHRYGRILDRRFCETSRAPRDECRAHSRAMGTAGAVRSFATSADRGWPPAPRGESERTSARNLEGARARTTRFLCTASTIDTSRPARSPDRFLRRNPEGRQERRGRTFVRPRSQSRLVDQQDLGQTVGRREVVAVLLDLAQERQLALVAEDAEGHRRERAGVVLVRILLRRACRSGSARPNGRR